MSWKRAGLFAFLRTAALLLAVGLCLIGRPSIAQGDERSPPAQFVGSAACAHCHAAEHADWRASHHAAAMQRASEATVLGRFDGASFKKDGAESLFFKRDDKFWVRTEGPDGKLAEFEIAYTFGVAPLQQYLLALPSGRLQAFGIAWDARPASEGGQCWYSLYPEKKLAPGHPLHWTGVDQNWNYQCAWCHTTNLKKNYDPASKGFRTEWTETGVGCEACHGPASNHLAWAEKAERAPLEGHGFALRFDERQNASWPMGDNGQAHRSTPREKAKEILVCAGCHSRREQFSDAPGSVARFFDAFRPSLLAAGLYHVDGQQRDEVFNYASFLQSKMYGGGVICSDCHNPHSGKLKFSGNAVCGQCHSPERFDQRSHHHHAADSTGALCANCHMPPSLYMGIDARHDHSMRIPRPDRTQTLGTPNACNSCHADKTAAWSLAAIKAWYSTPKPGAQDFAEAFDLADRNAPSAREALIRVIQDEAQSAIARASAFGRLAQTPSQQALELAARALTDASPLIRMSAVAAVAEADAAARAKLLAPLLSDETRLVRMDAARALAGEAEQSLSPQDRERFQAALGEYIAAQLFNAERAEAPANLGALHATRGELGAARAAYNRAIEIDAAFFPAAIALAELTRAQGDEAAAAAILQKAFAANPTAGALAHALGLSLIRQGRLDLALEKLAEAARLEPEEPRFAYVFAVALHDAGKTAQAIEVLKAALERRSYDAALLMALASYEVEAGDLESALSHAEQLAKSEPDNRQIQQFLKAVRALAK